MSAHAIGSLTRKNSKSIRYGVVAVLLIIALTASACVSAPTPTPAPSSNPPTAPAVIAPPTSSPVAPPTATGPTTFRIAIGIDPDTFDPAGQTTTTVGNLVDYVVETLVATDQDGKVLPLLAKSWTISKDGLEYTFKLQEGIKFHDGAPFDAAAVKANFDRLLDPDTRAPVRGVFMVIQKTEVVDSTTVKFTLKSPSAVLLAALGFTVAGIVSPATIDKNSPGYKTLTQPVGTGPYVFKEFAKGSQLTVTKNPNYWGKKPYYDTVIFRVVPEAATRESLLLAGQVDLIILPPISDVPALQKNPAVKVLLAPSDRTVFISLNMTQKPLDNVKVRQALNYAVNKEEIIKAILFGAADPLDAPTPSSLFGYCKSGSYLYDPAKAKQLLSEAGVAAGTKISFIAPTGRYLQDFQAAQAIAGYLKEVGLNAELATMDWPTYVGTMTKPEGENKVQLGMLGLAAPYLDADYQFSAFRSNQVAPKGLNTPFYKNPKVDDWASAALAETDGAKRKEIYCQAGKQVWEDAPWIFLWNQRFPIAYSAKVQNISSHPTEKFLAIYAEPVR